MQHIHTMSAGIKLYKDVATSVNLCESIIENLSNFTKTVLCREHQLIVAQKFRGLF